MGSTTQDDALRVKQLENKLAAVIAERNALEQDLEQMCLSRGSHMFSSSYVLAERLKYLEAEVKQQRNQLVQLTTARDNALEDILQVKALKRAADQGWQQERSRVAALEQELSFFQSALSEAISARDSASYEATVNKQRLEADIASAEARISSLEHELQVMQQQLAAAQQDCRRQRAAAEQASATAADLRVAADDASTDETIRQLQERNNQLKRLLAQATEEKVEALIQVASFQNHTSDAGLLESASHNSSSSPAYLKAMGPDAAPGVCLSPPSAAVSPTPDALADVAAVGGHGLSVSGNGSSSLKAMLTPPTPGRGLLAAETAVAELVAGNQARGPTKPSQQPPVLPEDCIVVKSLPGKFVQGAPAGQASTSINRDAAAAPADRHLQLPTPQLQETCRQQRLQLQQRLHGLELLLHFARQCRVVLDQVQPAAVADAAVAAAGSGQARRAKPPGKAKGASSPAPATADVLQALADAAKDLDGSRHLLLGATSASVALPPQHDSLLTPPHSNTPPEFDRASCRDWVAALIQLAAAPGPDGNNTTAMDLGAAGAGAAATGSTRGISAAVLGGLTQMFGSQSTVAGGVRGSANSRDQPSLQGRGGEPWPQEALTLCAPSSAPVQAAVSSESGDISSVMPAIGLNAGHATLDLAMQIQLLADGCVLALQQVQKITALSNLMGDCSW
eukprot:gene11817-11961_t